MIQYLFRYSLGITFLLGSISGEKQRTSGECRADFKEDGTRVDTTDTELAGLSTIPPTHIDITQQGVPCTFVRLLRKHTAHATSVLNHSLNSMLVLF